MKTLLNSFSTISLEEMKSVKLMNRMDAKFVTTEERLRALLELAKEDYLVQSINGEVMMPYYTRYYDTEDCEMYRIHVKGKLTRNKVRVRRYVRSGVEFLEVKRKNNKGRTDKKRVESHPSAPISDNHDFLLSMSGYGSDRLIPQIENSFNRITLVNRNHTERLTIDTGLSFHNIVSGLDHSLEGLVIIELKRDGRMTSPIASMLRSLRIMPSGFSKYCIGMALTNPGLPSHRLKPRLRRIGRMLRENN